MTYLTIFGKPRYLGLFSMENENFSNGWVVLKTARGYEMGLPGGKLTEEQKERFQSEKFSFDDEEEQVLQNVEFIREADNEDIENYYDCRYEEDEALLRGRDILAGHDLKMKLVDVEYMLDRRKLFFYFTADQRIDFRSYVRDLAREFKTRIELRQIGIRDEARIVRGIASCGRPCCCGYWLRGFAPISIKIVKEQRSALNPIKISGLCGRLMCCMSYEKDLYSELWSKLPGPGSKIRTEQGNYVLESLDIGNERVNIRFPSGRLVPVSISDFPDFQEAVLKGEEWGIDKELAEKKKKAQERIAALKERAERRKNNPKQNAKNFKLKPEKKDAKLKIKNKQAKSGSRENAPKRKRQRKSNARKNEE